MHRYVLLVVFLVAILVLFVLLCACRGTTPRPTLAPDSPAAHPVHQFLCAKYDADHDGRITRAEYSRSEHGFRQLDADQDGALTPADFDARFDGVPRLEGEFVYGEGAPELGDLAPDFTLPTTSGTSITLSSFRTRQPVVLIFGSFT